MNLKFSSELWRFKVTTERSRDGTYETVARFRGSDGNVSSRHVGETRWSLIAAVIHFKAVNIIRGTIDDHRSLLRGQRPAA
jgi:hypothetical protein